MRNVTILLAVAAMLALTVSASAAPEWVGDGTPNYEGFFNVADNWDPSGVPGASDWTYIKLGICKVQTTQNPNLLFVGHTGTAELKVLDGADLSTDWPSLNVGANDGTGLVTQTGGVVKGAINIGDSAYYSGTSDVGTYLISDGEIGGGAWNTSGNIHVGGSGTGTFNVVGTDPTINYYVYTQEAKGTLKIDLDAGQVSVIGGSGGGIDLNLAGNLVITGSAVGTTPIPIMKCWRNINGTFSSVTDGWTVDYGVTTPGVVTIIPEPATLALLGLGGIGVLLRRRRK